MPSVLYYPTPANEHEARELIARLEEAVRESQLRSAELMAYELIRFHWRRHAQRLDDAYVVIGELASGNLGDALTTCGAMRTRFASEPVLVVAA